MKIYAVSYLDEDTRTEIYHKLFQDREEAFTLCKELEAETECSTDFMWNDELECNEEIPYEYPKYQGLRVKELEVY